MSSHAQILQSSINQELTLRNLSWGTGSQALSLYLEAQIQVSLEAWDLSQVTGVITRMETKQNPLYQIKDCLEKLQHCEL